MLLNPLTPALVLAPMEGVTDAPMREVMGETGAFAYCVSEFLRVSQEPLPSKVFLRDVPELKAGSLTASGVPVQVQLLGGDPGRMAESARRACLLGASGIDINFGCPAPTVNRNDGGATLLKFPLRIREIVAAVRAAVPRDLPVSAKLRLGWDDMSAIHENSDMAAQGGASWITIHGRTRFQGYAPPAYWRPIGEVRNRLNIPVVANGEIWSLDDFRRCREQTGCTHFMLGRGALADPWLPGRIAAELGVGSRYADIVPEEKALPRAWIPWLEKLDRRSSAILGRTSQQNVRRLKQWLRLASTRGRIDWFERIKTSSSTDELYRALAH